MLTLECEMHFDIFCLIHFISKNASLDPEFEKFCTLMNSSLVVPGDKLGKRDKERCVTDWLGNVWEVTRSVRCGQSSAGKFHPLGQPRCVCPRPSVGRQKLPLLSLLLFTVQNLEIY